MINSIWVNIPVGIVIKIVIRGRIGTKKKLEDNLNRVREALSQNPG